MEMRLHTDLPLNHPMVKRITTEVLALTEDGQDVHIYLNTPHTAEVRWLDSNTYTEQWNLHTNPTTRIG